MEKQKKVIKNNQSIISAPAWTGKLELLAQKFSESYI